MLRTILDWLTGRNNRSRRKRRAPHMTFINERSRAELGGALSRGLKRVDNTLKRSET